MVLYRKVFISDGGAKCAEFVTKQDCIEKLSSLTGEGVKIAVIDLAHRLGLRLSDETDLLIPIEKRWTVRNGLNVVEQCVTSMSQLSRGSPESAVIGSHLKKHCLLSKTRGR